jgi:MYXO-CTERM domain-containing protein
VGGEQIDIVFDEPTYWIAADFPGGMIVQLYLEGEMFYQSCYFGGTGYGNFGGLLSTLAFDRAVLRDDDEYVAIDDLHFGPPIPAPSAMVLLSAALLTVRRRRRQLGLLP